VVENVVTLHDAAVAEEQTDVAQRQVPAMDAAYLSCGRKLRHRRQETNADAEKIAKQLRIPVAYLDAIETDNWGLLPGRAYAIGYVRAYAEKLGLDADELANNARSEITPDSPARIFKFPAPIYRTGRAGVAVFLSAIVICSVIAAVLYL